VYPAFLRLGPVLVVLMSTGVWAQPGPDEARELKARQVVLGEEPTEVRVHPDFLTTLAFSADIVPGSVVVERPERVRVLSVEGSVVVLEPTEELGKGERVRVWVALARESAPVRAELVLVAHPSEVDVQVRVVRPEQPERAARPAEPSDQPELMRLLLSEEWLLGKKLTGTWLMARLFSEGVNAESPWLCQSGEQRVLAIRIHNPEGASPWEPRGVWLRSEALGPKPVALSARMRVPRLMPGERGWVLVDLPRQGRVLQQVFHLEVRERESGRGFRVEWEGR
jgi:uncharacterized protein (TIGR02268 family)